MSRRAPRTSSASKSTKAPRKKSANFAARQRSPGESSKKKPSDRASRSSRATWSQRFLIGSLIVATGYVGGNWTLHRSFLSVQHVQTRGLVHESVAQVLSVTGLNLHPALIDVSDAVIERRLERLTWVRSATVTKRWPSTIVLSVIERSPVAVVYNQRHQLVRVDSTGHALDVISLSRNLPLLEVVGRAIRAPWPFRPWSAAAALVAGALPAPLQSQVAAVRVSRLGALSLRLTTPLTFILGAPTQLTAKFESVAAVIKASAVNNVALHAGDVIDVSVPGTLTVSGR